MSDEWIEDLNWQEKAKSEVMYWFVRTTDIGFDRWAVLEEETKQHFDALMIDGIRVEIKARRGKYVNFRDILVETHSCEERDTPGWIYTTQAEYLAYAFVDEKTREILRGSVLHFPKLLNWWINVGRNNQYEIKRGTTGKLYHTVNRVIPEGDLPLELFYYHPKHGLIN